MGVYRIGQEKVWPTEQNAVIKIGTGNEITLGYLTVLMNVF
jgi:hypothetical protein